MGAHGKNDEWDIPSYMQHLFAPYCIANQARVLWDGSTATNVVNACAALNPVSLGKPSGDPALQFWRLLWGSVNAAGLGYMPYDALVNITMGAPYRVMTAVFSQIQLQERYNFITPYYTIGHGGEDTTATPDSFSVAARVAGAPVAGSYTAIVNGGATNAHAFVRIFAENNDAPFYRVNPYDVAGINNQVLSRFVNSQFQSFLLTTAFLSGNKYMTAADQAAPWNTNIVLPISVDAIYVDNIKLPMAVNTTWALPRTGIFTVRHGSQSIVIRILRADRSSASNIPDASSAFAITGKQNLYQNGVGLQEYSLVWQVDPMSVQAGVGRIVIHHKHRSTSDTLPNQYRISMLWVAGITRTDPEMWALQRQVRRASVTESITPAG
jgi:hypothetical protein